MNLFIYENQTAFIKGRSITEGILYAHEIVRGFSRKDNNMCIKIDLRKAYDSINRSFMIHVKEYEVSIQMV